MDYGGDLISDVTASGFRNLYAYSSSGDDRATLNGSDGDDRFYGHEDRSYLTGPGYLSYTTGFSAVTADASGTLGDDWAFLYDSVGDDSFNSDPAIATMQLNLPSGDIVTNESISFDRVYAFMANGGSEFVDLIGSDAADRFVGRSDYGYLTNDADYYVYVKYLDALDTVFADSGDAESNGETTSVVGQAYDFFMLGIWD
jgi:hypothetical protein